MILHFNSGGYFYIPKNIGKIQYLHDYNTLPIAQDDIKNDRHKCAGRAYIEGLKYSLNNKPIATTLSQSI